MNLAKVNVGDTVRCIKLGREFTATVLKKEPHYVVIKPPKGITYTRLSSREIKRKL